MNGKVQQLDKGSVFLGTFENMPACEIGEIDITNEALILTYTDGLTDVRNEDGDFLDETFGHRFMLDHYKLNAEAFNIELMEEINKFKGNTGFPDDLTVLTCKIY
jgi:sigma-B regulation protein RsbU (phosphoserine phosphatase)